MFEEEAHGKGRDGVSCRFYVRGRRGPLQENDRGQVGRQCRDRRALGGDGTKGARGDEVAHLPAEGHNYGSKGNYFHSKSPPEIASGCMSLYALSSKLSSISVKKLTKHGYV